MISEETDLIGSLCGPYDGNCFFFSVEFTVEYLLTLVFNVFRVDDIQIEKEKRKIERTSTYVCVFNILEERLTVHFGKGTLD